MVDFLGPGAFDCARPAATRPTHTPANLPGDPFSWFQDCSSPQARDGTEWRAPLLNFLIANLRGLVGGSGLAPSNLDDTIIAGAIQSGGMNFAVATGTANNWTVALNLALASYRAGRVLWLKAPATNTSTTVVVTVDGLAARPLKKRNGGDPTIGDLVGGTFYPTIDDGTNICVVTALASDINAAIRATPVYGLVAAPAATFNVPDNTLTKISTFGTVVNNLPGTTLSGGDLTIGLAGYYDISFYLGSNYAMQSGSYSFVTSVNVNGVSKIGSSGSSINSTGLGLGAFFSGAGLLKLAVGDVITLTQKHNSGVTQNAPMGLSVVFRGA